MANPFHMAAACLTLMVVPMNAVAQTRYTAESVGPAVDRLEAISTVQSAIAADYRQCAIVATGWGVRYQCSGDLAPGRSDARDGEFVSRDFPSVGTTGSPPLLNLYEAPGDRRAAHQLLLLHSPRDTRVAVAHAWIALAHPPPSASASADSEFTSAVDAAPPIESRTDELRRVQVQVEGLLRASRNADAARLYRDSLRTAPNWAEGHFNLGLLYGELEFYFEAITEMRRYLHLAPNADDVRAVQDRIYEWEAAMGSTP